MFVSIYPTVQMFTIMFILVLFRSVDFVNMMDYDNDGWGPSNPVTDYNTTLFSESRAKNFFNPYNLVSFNLSIFKRSGKIIPSKQIRFMIKNVTC